MKQMLLTVCLFLLSSMAWGQDAELVRKAKQGDTEAQGKLAHDYFLKNQYYDATRWAKPAGEKGDAIAQYVLARLYKNGKGGLPEDEKFAFTWAHSSAAQGFSLAMLELGEWYKNTDRERAIYWYKKCTDTFYQETGYEDPFAGMRLNELNIEYHPNKNSASANSSSSSISSISRGNSKLLYKGIYTENNQAYCATYGRYTDPQPQLPDFCKSIEIYDDYIMVDSKRYDFHHIEDGCKFYGKKDAQGEAVYYKVNPSNFEMAHINITKDLFGNGFLRFIWAMHKGKTQFSKIYPNTGSYSGGYNSTLSNSGSSKTPTTSSTTITQRQPTRHTCSLCKGKKRIGKEFYPSTFGGPNPKEKCNECGKFFPRSFGHSHITCPQCHGKGFFTTD